jgi:hypothetical protein
MHLTLDEWLVGKWSIQVLVGLPSASARPTPPREDTRHLGCLPLCWVKHTRHMALQLPCPGRIARPARHLVRPDTWAALPMCWVRPDVALRLACPEPRANGSFVGTQFSWVLCDPIFMGPLSGPGAIGSWVSKYNYFSYKYYYFLL